MPGSTLLKRATLAALACAAASIAAPAAADAATRYAVPGGAGSGACTAVADACSLASAVAATTPGDTVIVRAGTHTLAGRVSAFSQITIVGQPGPRPVVQGPDPGPGYGLLDLQSGSSMSHLDLRFTGASDRPLLSLQGVGGLLRDLVITNSGSSSGVTLYAGTMDTVVVRSTGSTFASVVACSATIRNATITGGAGYAAIAEAGLCGPIVLDVSNTLARGPTGAFRLAAAEGMPDRPVTLNIDHSNYVTVTKVATVPDSLYDINESANQSEEPQLVDLALGDIHQLAGSPTVDAGTANGIGPTDIDGQPRSTGAAPDIGADERPPVASPATPAQPSAPAVPAAPARDITAPVISAARLSPRRFRVGPPVTATRRAAPKGTTFSYTLSERADVTLRMERRKAGIRIRRTGRKGRSCVPASRANRRTLKRQLLRRASIRRLAGKQRARALRRTVRRRRCARYRQAGTLRLEARGPGAVRTPFSGRIGGRALKLGRYRSELRATDLEGNVSAPRRLAFRVVKRR